MMKKSIIFALLLSQIFQGNVLGSSPDSYTPHNTDSIPNPWSVICLICAEAKVLSTTVIPVNTGFPWIPVIGGVIVAGVATYFITQDNDNPSDCDFTASSQISPSTCELPNGAITISVTPADQYEFVWSNGSTNSSLQNVVTGNYSVTITRTGTDCNVILPLTVTNSNPTFTATITTEDSECGLQNGSAIVNVNPAADYTYSWSNVGSTGPTQMDMAPGDYFVVVSLGGACSDDYSFHIGELPPTFEIVVTTTPSACGESDGTGSIQVTPDGNYDYVWSNTSTGSQVSGLAGGEYSITVSIPGTQCSKTITTNVEELPPNFEITTTTTPSGCSDSTGTANIAIEPSGTYDITWSNGITGSQATGLAEGEYQITVTIAGTSCSKTTSISITALPPSFVITSTTTPSGCSDSTGTANITIEPSGTYDIMWSNGLTGSQATGLAEGEYQVTVTISGTTCSITTTITITELPPSFVITSTTTPTGCSDSSGTANITIEPSGTYDITWSNGMTGSQVTGLAMGEYQVTVTIAGTTCSITTTITITELPPSFVISSTTTPSGCTDSTGTATITVDPSGQYDIIWSNGLTGPQVTGLAAGDYTVTVSISGTMCSNTATVTVGQSGVEFTGTISVDTADCGVANGSATIVIDPEGSYTIVWSNQQTGPVAQQLIAGNYSVVVTDINGCSSSFSTVVTEDPAEYISIVNTIPGNCAGGGDITIMLTTPGIGPLILQVVGPDGSVSFTLIPGTYQLSAFMNVSAGNYTLTVYDQVIGQVCLEVVSATVMNNTPLPEALDDFYNTPGGIPITANALDNDSGLNLEMTVIANILGGTVVFNNSGEFTFTPDPGFTGDASFTYTVMDACGQTDTAIVTIVVEEVICDFTLDVTTTPATCGFSDGNIFVDVIEAGSYGYTWDTGDAGPVLNNVAAGSYTVTVENLDLGCSLDFTITLSENPADYIDNIVVTQPTCSMEGEISFDVSSQGTGQLTMVVDHPNGIEAFNIDEGTVFLSDYVSIVTGLYTIEVSDPEAGPDCFESFSVDILQPSTIQIVVEAVIPPSTPTAEDGAIVVVVTVPGEVPYTILLNGIPVSSTTQNNFIIEGLGAGIYTVQIFDAEGCLSNVLEVNVPFPDIILSFGSGVIHSGPFTTIPEQTLSEPSSQWNTSFIASLQYFIGNKSQEVRILYAISAPNNKLFTLRYNYLTLDYLSEITRKEWKKINMKFQGGIGLNYIPQTQTSLFSEPQHWILRGNLNRNIGKHLNLQCSASLLGWKNIEPPVIDFSLAILFPKAIRKF